MITTIFFYLYVAGIPASIVIGFVMNTIASIMERADVRDWTWYGELFTRTRKALDAIRELCEFYLVAIMAPFVAVTQGYCKATEKLKEHLDRVKEESEEEEWDEEEEKD